MARINNFVKFAMINLNIIASLIGLGFFCFAFYMWFSNWGALDKGFFQGVGGAVFLFGLSVMLGSCIGCQGITNQTVKFGFWTGRKIITIHLILLTAGLAIEIYILKSALSAVQQFDVTYQAMKDHPTDEHPYVIYENFISTMFNRFFFGAGSECGKAFYYWFWGWVDGNCPASLSSARCQGCETYSLTFCEADSSLCFAEGTETEGNPYCPYTICRGDILNYAHVRILPFSIALGVLALFQLVLILLDILILCYHPRDTLEQILYKSGTLGKLRGHSTAV